MAFQPPAHTGPSVEFKVVLLGDKGVGKTCLVLRFIEGTFTQKQQVSVMVCVCGGWTMGGVCVVVLWSARYGTPPNALPRY